MDYYNLYIKFIFIVKILFIILAVYELYIKHKEPKNAEKIENIRHTKNRVELLFKGLMSILLIYLFSPKTSKEMMKMDYETRLLLWLFGFIILITADWNHILHDTPTTFKMLQEIVGKTS